MPNVILLQNNFTSGELMPEAKTRYDKDFRSSGLDKLQNMVVKKRGGVSRRKGTTLVSGVPADLPSNARLIPFTFSNDDTLMLVLWHDNTQARLGVIERDYDETDPDNPIPLQTATFTSLPATGVGSVSGMDALSYTADEIATLNHIQSNDVLILTCPTKPPRELARLPDSTGDNGDADDNPDWSLTDVVYLTDLPVIQGLSVVSNTMGDDKVEYAVVAQDAEGSQSVIPRRDPTITADTRSTDKTGVSVLNSVALVVPTSSPMGLAVGSIGFTNPNLYLRLGNTRLIAVASDASVYYFGVDRQYSGQLNLALELSLSFIHPNEGGITYNSASAEWDNTITWTALTQNDLPTGVDIMDIRYVIYKWDDSNSAWGFLGQVLPTGEGDDFVPAVATFTDDNIEEDSTSRPTQSRNPFDTSTSRPLVSDFFKQRQVFANTRARPQTIFMSKVGDFNNFNVNIPQADDDSIIATLDSTNFNAIVSMVALQDLIVFTEGGEWVITGRDSVLTPTDIRVERQSAYGIENKPLLRPLLKGQSVIFMQVGNRMRDLAYEFSTDIYQGTELSILSEHMLQESEPTSWCYSELPNDIIWITRADGVMVACTYLKEQRIVGWSKHSTDKGEFKQVASVREDGQDAVYMLVNRWDRVETDGTRVNERLQIERMIDWRKTDGVPYKDAMTTTGTGDDLVYEDGTGFMSALRTLPAVVQDRDLPSSQNFQLRTPRFTMHGRVSCTPDIKYEVINRQANEMSFPTSPDDPDYEVQKPSKKATMLKIPQGRATTETGDLLVFDGTLDVPSGMGGYGVSSQIQIMTSGELQILDIYSMQFVVSLDIVGDN